MAQPAQTNTVSQTQSAPKVTQEPRNNDANVVELEVSLPRGDVKDEASDDEVGGESGNKGGVAAESIEIFRDKIKEKFNKEGQVDYLKNFAEEVYGDP